MANDKKITVDQLKGFAQEADERFIDENELEERLSNLGSSGEIPRTIMSETEPEDLQTDEFWDHIMVEIECPDELIPYATLTITGTGNTSYCYATINGTKYSSAASGLTVEKGSQITFGVYGRSSTYYGNVTVNGQELLNVTNQSTQTCTWTVPNGTKTISISFSYTSTSSQRRGRITVTTT